MRPVLVAVKGRDGRIGGCFFGKNSVKINNNNHERMCVCECVKEMER